MVAYWGGSNYWPEGTIDLHAIASMVYSSTVFADFVYGTGTGKVFVITREILITLLYSDAITVAVLK